MAKIKDLEKVEQEFVKHGFNLVSAQPGPMDSGIAIFSNGPKSLRIIKDRSQWSFDTDKKLLESLGLWKAFDRADDFCNGVPSIIKNLK
jgi:hypothetical protein